MSNSSFEDFAESIDEIIECLDIYRSTNDTARLPEDNKRKWLRGSQIYSIVYANRKTVERHMEMYKDTKLV